LAKTLVTLIEVGLKVIKNLGDKDADEVFEIFLSEIKKIELAYADFDLVYYWPNVTAG
jgi:hypothetical protein